MSEGWISLHRRIRDHWIYLETRKFSKFEAWLDLLMSANHKDNRFVLGNELVDVKRGQFITSIRQLGEKWSWSNTKVIHYLNLLQRDGMIKAKKDTKKTVITVVKYDFFNSKSKIKKTEKIYENSDLRTHKHTNNNENKVNKYIKEDTYKETKTDLPSSPMNFKVIEYEKDNLLKESLKDSVPPKVFKTLCKFSGNYDEMYEWIGIIFRAKAKVEAQRDVNLRLEEIDEHLNQTLIRVIRKVKKDSKIDQIDNYFFFSVFTFFERFAVDNMTETDYYETASNWVESSDV